MFKTDSIEVESKLEKKIKIVIFYHGGEYHGKYYGRGVMRPLTT